MCLCGEEMVRGLNGTRIWRIKRIGADKKINHNRHIRNTGELCETMMFYVSMCFKLPRVHQLQLCNGGLETT
jgi:hypothetical protein